MAMSSKERGEFGFKNIELLKSNNLGSGSYGAVYRAVCDGLPCAAKIMHPTLFDLSDPSSQQYLSNFRRECLLLSSVRHPNIVQYLAVTLDSNTGLPVLLMELCQQNLSQFLQHLSSPLEFHVELNICHDITLALVYLHSNGLIHRDLTGNNVLMIAGPQAKITDFGMSKLATTNPRMKALTQCPGNSFYMPPEALDNSKSYTTKLDIFSFGVIAIQIITREFPNPTGRLCRVIVPQFDEPLLQVVSEVQRRKNHLDLISESHPLRETILECIRQKEDQRPSALHLVEKFSSMKHSTPAYQESKRGTRVETWQQKLHERDKELEARFRELKRYKAQIQELQWTVERLKGELDTKKRHRRERADIRLAASCDNLDMSTRELEITSNSEIKGYSVANSAYVTMEIPHNKVEIQILSDPEETPEDVPTVPKTPGGPQRVGKPETPIKPKRNNEQGTANNPKTTSKPKATSKPQRTNSPYEAMDSAIDYGTDSQTDRVKVWRKGAKSPIKICRGSAVADGERVYLRPAGTETIYSYSSRDDEWSLILPHNPHQSCSLTIISGTLTSVGGVKGGFTGSLLSLITGVVTKGVGGKGKRRGGATSQTEEKVKLKRVNKKAGWVREKKRDGKGGGRVEKDKEGSMEIEEGKEEKGGGGGGGGVRGGDGEGGGEAGAEGGGGDGEGGAGGGARGGEGGGGGGAGAGQSGGEGKQEIEDDTVKEWVAIFPPMPTPRRSTTCFTTDDHLVVIGGYGSLGDLNTVEMMKINSKQWYKCSPLSQKCCQLSGALHSNSLYLTGGYSASNETGAVFRATLSDIILNKSSTKTLSKFRRQSFNTSVWREVSSLPVAHSTLVSFGGELLAIGGEIEPQTPTVKSYRYDPVCDSWSEIDLVKKRKISWCFALPLSETELMVAGGYTEKCLSTNDVDILSYENNTNTSHWV